MRDFVVAFGLVLVFEGVLWAANPAWMRAMMTEIMGRPDSVLRRVGLIAAVFGLGLVWLIRG